MSFPPSTMPFGTTTLVQKLSLLSKSFLRSSTSILTLSGLFYAALASQTAHAECTTNKPVQISWNKASYDPKPSADADKEELVLPMPCGGAMVFRRVTVPPTSIGGDKAAFLANRRVRIGKPMSPGDLQNKNNNGYNAFMHESNLAAPFSDESKNSFYYIGKYEVTKSQYDLLMSNSDGTPPIPRRNLPANNMTFLQAQQFSENWTTWLKKNSPDTLPKRGGKSGLVRLPTDIEWAFAATGGGANKDSLSSNPEPWPQAGSNCANNLDDCIVGNAQGTATPDGIVLPKPIGSRSIANPLSLYDMLGNVSEMVLTPYQMRIYLNYWNQGLPGGIQVFGGSSFNPASELSSAFRTEFDPYDDKGNPNHSPYVGFRVVISAMALGDLAAAGDAQKAFDVLRTGAANSESSQVKEDHKNESNALKNLQDSLNQENQSKNDLQEKLKKLSQAMDTAREAQNQANVERQQADLDSTVANLTTLITLSKQIAANRVDIVNYTNFINDPDNAHNPNIAAYKHSIETETISLDDATHAYSGLLQSLTRNKDNISNIPVAQKIIETSLTGNYKDLPLSRRIDWLHIAIHNAQTITSGATPNVQDDIILKIEEAAHMNYYKK